MRPWSSSSNLAGTASSQLRLTGASVNKVKIPFFSRISCSSSR